MGVRGLTTLLNKSATSCTLGCTNEQCKISSNVVVDGPGLAYWINSKLVSGYVDTGQQTTRPSLDLIEQTLLSVLNSFEQNKIKILKIYFDGGLPDWKRATRFYRLHEDFKTRSKLRATNPTGIELQITSLAPWPVDDVIKATDESSKIKRDLVSPLLVASVIEILRDSRYKGLIEIVPGEADAWCAAYSTKHGALILSDDSDLAIHDTGKGRVVFFANIDKGACETCNSQAIMAKILHPERTVREFAVDDMKHVAFKLQSLSGASKGEDCRQSGRTTKRNKTSHPLGKLTFEEFCARYEKVSLEQDQETRQIIQYFDPRLSEVIVQVLDENTKDPIAILPSLLDDPTKSSAWKVSEAIRYFAYSLILETIPGQKLTKLMEYQESGQNTTQARMVKRFDSQDIIDTAASLVQMLNLVRNTVDSQDACSNVRYWKLTCSIHVCYHNLASSQMTGKALRSTLSRSTQQDQPDTKTWPVLHFQAQLEATYYAFRQLQQILRYLQSAGKLSTDSPTYQLMVEMDTLPGIVEMHSKVEGRSDTQADIQFILEVASSMLENEDEM